MIDDVGPLDPVYRAILERNAQHQKELDAKLAKRKKQLRRQAFWGGFLYITFVFCAGAMFRGWLLMFAVGIAHHEWIQQLPTIGYWWSCLLAALFLKIDLRIPASISRKGKES